MNNYFKLFESFLQNLFKSRESKSFKTSKHQKIIHSRGLIRVHTRWVKNKGNRCSYLRIFDQILLANTPTCKVHFRTLVSLLFIIMDLHIPKLTIHANLTQISIGGPQVKQTVLRTGAMHPLPSFRGSGCIRHIRSKEAPALNI